MYVLAAHMDRRDFIQAGLAGAALVRGQTGARQSRPGPVIWLVADPADPIASSVPARWALAEFSQRLTDAGCTVRNAERTQEARGGEACVVASGMAPTAAPESLSLIQARVAGRRVLLASGADARGLCYALLELAGRVSSGTPPLRALTAREPISQRPANAVRSVMRQFTSEPLDTPWFEDRAQWTRYLTVLAGHRFNRLHLAFGLGYDSLQRVTDSYLLFLYPFLLPVPGYDVRVTNLPDAKRERNLDLLRFISEQAAVRGLDFQLGIWMHGYQLTNSPDARYVVEGLTAETHAAYCRDALTAVLRACPAIASVGLRIHGESGIAEGSYEFWGTVFDGVARCGRTVEIDLHAKGIDATMIARAAATGMPVNLSPKFAAEHCGMPYHQAAIRELEMPVAGRTGAGLMTLSEGSRVFTRYGYADLLREDRHYTVRPRVFAGTQRLLASGDPAWAAAYARAFQFCGMTGGDLMEPLTCRGRRGTGTGRRSGYADLSLAPGDDWEKYADWYRAWGRKLYDPDHDVGATGPVASALRRASRILPIVTNAHLPSAACDAYWPEIYWNQPMVAESPRNPYFDTGSPTTFQHVSPLDPQLFSSPSEFAGSLLRGEPSGKYSPVEVAQWVEDLAAGASDDLSKAGATSAAQLRVVTDIQILAGLGRFFGAKLRSGVLYAIHEQTGDKRAVVAALAFYQRARDAWSELAERARGVYQADLSASDRFSERGQWSDRLALIDADIAQMTQRVSATAAVQDPRAEAAMAQVYGAPRRAGAAGSHTPPAGFRAAADLTLELAVPGRAPTSVRLFYRHVNQAERYQVVEMTFGGGRHRAAIPAAYTDSPFPLQYYFALTRAGRAWVHPGFNAELSNQPYFVVRSVPS